MQAPLKVTRKSIKIVGDTSRVITRLHLPGEGHRIQKIMHRILNMSEAAADKLLAQVMIDFSGRHEDIDAIFEHHYQAMKAHLPLGATPSDSRRALIGAYFTKEYAIESAALFNPSIVAHPDQTHLKKGCLRFVMSLRATGEGHVSSIVFRSGVLNLRNKFFFDPISAYVETPQLELDPVFKRYPFQRKLNEMGANKEITTHIMNQLGKDFTYNELLAKIEGLQRQPLFSITRQYRTFEVMCWLADSNYEVSFHADHRISERVIFPVSRNESRGIEDARFVQFFDSSQAATYYATYTAYNGNTILPQLIETKDFIKFKVLTLNGKAVQNKGMALFPRKIGGRYVMLSRQDGENNHIMFSDNIHFWQNSQVIQEPEFPWEFIQIGNCGSPLETQKGWLVLTHGVGPMRQYCIGAILLDLDDPTKIVSRMDDPLLVPHEKEREGYVPNVVYSCGAIIHNDEVVIPYAMSDINSGIATVALDALLASMRVVA
jgi:predicted GH43/DUF377 family glycosyl hydrolase